MTPLRQRMTEDMRVRNLSPLTIKLYINAVVKFSKFFNKSPALLGPEEVRTYQLYLINQKKASWSAFNIAVSALRFLYAVTLKTDWAFEKIPYAKRPRKKPVILSLEEVCAFIKIFTNLKHRVMVMLAYSGGLRVSEVVNLHVWDIDSKRMMIRIELGKGQKDRYVPLSQTLLQWLRLYWKTARPTSYLFPGKAPGMPMSRASMNKAITCARRAAGISKTVNPRGPAQFRHAFAGFRNQHTHHPGIAGTSQPEHHHTLHNCLQRHHSCNSEPFRVAVRSS